MVGRVGRRADTVLDPQLLLSLFFFPHGKNKAESATCCSLQECRGGAGVQTQPLPLEFIIIVIIIIPGSVA